MTVAICQTLVLAPDWEMGRKQCEDILYVANVLQGNL